MEIKESSVVKSPLRIISVKVTDTMNKEIVQFANQLPIILQEEMAMFSKKLLDKPLKILLYTIKTNFIAIISKKHQKNHQLQIIAVKNQKEQLKIKKRD